MAVQIDTISMFETITLNHQELAFVAQRIEHLTTDQKVGGSSPSKRTNKKQKPANYLELFQRRDGIGTESIVVPLA